MRILTRYILREITSHALIGAGVFTFVLFTRDLGRLLELVVRNSAPLPSVGARQQARSSGRRTMSPPRPLSPQGSQEQWRSWRCAA